MVNIRELRDTGRLKEWLNAGETVEVRERNTVLGRIIPAEPGGKRVWPDFRARAQEILGERVLAGADLLIEERESERY